MHEISLQEARFTRYNEAARGPMSLTSPASYQLVGVLTETRLTSQFARSVNMMDGQLKFNVAKIVGFLMPGFPSC